MSYPKVCTHRHDPHAKVVVANAEQEAELPEEFREALRGDGSNGPQATAADALLLTPEYAEFVAARDQLAADRTALTEGYKADKALLDADRELLDAERAQFEQEKADFVAAQAAVPARAKPGPKPKEKE